MRRLLIILTIGALVPFVSPPTSSTAPRVAYQDRKPTSREIKFELTNTQENLTAENYKFTTETWKSSDGVTIFLTKVSCGSTRSAARTLHQSMRKARVLTQSIVRDKHRRSVGQRVVLSYSSPGKAPARVILWTNRDKFNTIDSSSFPHALLFEKRLAKP